MTNEETVEKLINKTKELQELLIDFGNDVVDFEKTLFLFAEEVRKTEKEMKNISENGKGKMTRMSPVECLTRALRICGVYISDDKVEEVAGEFMVLLKLNRYVKDGVWNEY